jgi:hypothetical protein
LAHEGRAVHLPECREEVGVVTAEVGEQLRLAVEAEVLADDLDGQHLRIKEHRARPALAQPLRPDPAQSVVNDAEGGYNQRVQVHGRPPGGELEHFPLEGQWAWTFNFSNN